LNTQEAYELMRIYLTRPGARQAVESPDESCRYEIVLDGEIHRCAIGCLLSPQALEETVLLSNEDGELDGTPMEDKAGEVVALKDFLGGLSALAQAGYSLDDLADVEGDFLDGAQALHDSEGCWENGMFDVRRLDELAARHGLKVVEVVA
jgi:hypothetical protein